MYILTLEDILNKIMEPFKDFIQNNYSNPLLWLVLFLGGLGLFFFTYNSLHKD